MVKGRTEPKPLTDEEIRLLASIIVYSADTQPVYSADETALALIRLVAGVAARQSCATAQDAVYFVALGAFGNTNTHGEAVDRFCEQGRRLDIGKLAAKGGRE